MLKLMGRSVAVLTLTAAALVVSGATEPAAACNVNGDGCGGTNGPVSGNGTVTISVWGTYVDGGSGGSGGSSTQVTVPTPCYYVRGMTGKEYAEWVDSGEAQYMWYHTGEQGQYKPYPGYRAHKDDDKGAWYSPTCSSESFEDLDEFFDFVDDYFATHETTYVEADETPPVPPIPPEVLLDAAMQALTIPEPEFARNPSTEGAGATLVNIENWFWLDIEEPLQGSVTAQAGPWSATVDIGLSNVEYHSEEAGSVVCADGGTEWSPGAESECVLSFPRPAEPATVTANARWDGTWSFNGEPQGAIDPLTSEWSTSFPVLEQGSRVTFVD